MCCLFCLLCTPLYRFVQARPCPRVWSSVWISSERLWLLAKLVHLRQCQTFYGFALCGFESIYWPSTIFSSSRHINLNHRHGTLYPGRKDRITSCKMEPNQRKHHGNAVLANGNCKIFWTLEREYIRTLSVNILQGETTKVNTNWELARVGTWWLLPVRAVHCTLQFTALGLYY